MKIEIVFRNFPKLLLLVLLLETSCYCFEKNTVQSSVRYLEYRKKYSLCNWVGGDGTKSMIVNPYYGYFSSYKQIEENKFKMFKPISFSSNGQFGVKSLKFVSPLIYKYSILGLGLNISAYNHTLSFNKIQGENIHLKEFNGSLSLNLLTSVNELFITYVFYEPGYSYQKSLYSGINPDITKLGNFSSGNFRHSIGAGVQIYAPNYPAGISLEATYGNCTYCKTGIYIWF